MKFVIKQILRPRFHRRLGISDIYQILSRIEQTVRGFGVLGFWGFNLIKKCPPVPTIIAWTRTP